MLKATIVVFALASPAVSSRDDGGSQVSTLSAQAQDLSVTLHEQMAAIAEHDRGDCPKLAVDLRATIDAVSPPVLGSDNLGGEIGSEDDELPDVAPEIHALDATHFARVDAARQRMRPILQSCARNAALRLALRQLSL